MCLGGQSADSLLLSIGVEVTLIQAIVSTGFRGVLEILRVPITVSRGKNMISYVPLTATTHNERYGVVEV